LSRATSRSYASSRPPPKSLVRLAYARASVPFERISAALTEQQ